MALEWDVSAIDLSVRSDGEGHMSDETYAMIWASMITRMPEITAENAPEFYARLELHRALFGDIWEIITLDVVKAHVGLKTNCYSSDAKSFTDFAMAEVRRWDQQYLTILDAD